MNKRVILLFIVIVAGLLIVFMPFKDEEVSGDNVFTPGFAFDQSKRYIYHLDYLSDIVMYLNSNTNNNIKNDFG